MERILHPHLSYEPTEPSLQTCLTQSKKKPTPVDFKNPDGSLITDLKETITYMLDYLIPKDEVDNNTDYDKK